MSDIDKLDQDITDILLEDLVLATDNGQPYIQYTDVAVDKILAIISTAVREARLEELRNFNQYIPEEFDVENRINEVRDTGEHGWCLNAKHSTNCTLNCPPFSSELENL